MDDGAVMRVQSTFNDGRSNLHLIKHVKYCYFAWPKQHKTATNIYNLHSNALNRSWKKVGEDFSQ